MIFDGKSVHSITDDEIKKIVESKECERQHLEYKATVNYKKSSDRLEILRDITSLANAGGGYLLVGVKDNGHGVPVGFCPDLVGNPESIKKSISMLAHEYIEERIDGIEVVVRSVAGNAVVIVRVPPSEKMPHMVTFESRTDFWCRYHDGKREMTFAEIKAMFNRDAVALKLTNMEKQIGIISKQLYESGQSIKSISFKPFAGTGVPAKAQVQQHPKGGVELLQLKMGHEIINAASAKFEHEIKAAPCFWMAACPVHADLGMVDVTSPQIAALLKEPPGSTPNGWNMEAGYQPIKRTTTGVERGNKDFEYLSLTENGLMEFWTPLNDHFCWRQSEEEFKKNPRLYPYSVIEYPVTFLRLYKAICAASNLKGQFIIRLWYKNVRGYVLRPFAPNSIGFEIPTRDVIPYGEQDLKLPDLEIDSQFDSEQTGFEIAKRFYAAFGHYDDVIPFYDRGVKEFSFPRS
jgi:hypothetical protein